MAPRDLRRPLDAADPEAGLTNARIAAVLSEIGDLLEIKGESSFKVGAYRRAADSVARSGVEVAAAYREGDPPKLRGVGGSIGERIEELATSGHLAYLEALRAEVPPTLLELLAIPGVGPRTAGEVWRSLGIATLPELEVAARDGRLRQLRGISAKSETRILEGIGELQQRPPRRMRMGEAQALAQRVVALIEALPGVASATAAGSVRRYRETVGDLDVLVETDQPGPVLAALRPAARGRGRGDRRSRWRRALQRAPPRWPAARHHGHAAWAERQLPRPLHGLGRAQRGPAPSCPRARLVPVGTGAAAAR